MQIVQMERLMLQALDYHLIAPSSSSFLHHYLEVASSASQQTSVQHLAQVKGYLLIIGLS